MYVHLFAMVKWMHARSATLYTHYIKWLRRFSYVHQTTVYIFQVQTEESSNDLKSI